MNKEMQTLILSLVVKLGIEATILLLKNMNNAKTIDDAIAALETSAAKTWQDFKNEV